MDEWLERGITALVLAMLVFAVLATGAVRDRDFVVVQGLLAGATGLWVARFWVNPGHRVQWLPVCWLLVLFAGYAVVRYWQADVEYVARRELIRVLVYVWLFFLVLNNLHRQETTRVMTYALLGVGTLVAMYALYQFLAGSNRVWGFERPEAYDGRGSGTYICPNHLAGLLEMLLPVGLAMVLLGRDSLVNRVLIGYAVVMMLGGLAVTVSRGGWIAAGVALAVLGGVLIRYRNYRRLVLVAAAVVVLAGGVFVKRSTSVQDRFRLMFQGGQLQDVRIRYWLTQATAAMWWDHFWVGVGPAHFDVRFPQYRPREVQSRPLWAHNDYLNVLADWGLIGGGLLGGAVLLIGLGVPRTWRYVNRERDGLVRKRSDRAAHVLGVSIGLLALGVHSAMDFNLQIPANAMVAMVLAASLTSHRRFSTREFWVRPRLAGRVAVTLAGGVTVVYLGMQGVQRWREVGTIEGALRAPNAEAQWQLLNAAVRIEPKNAESAARLGEFYRLESWEGSAQWRWMADQALEWFGRAIALNPWETFNHTRLGMCLDWLGRTEEATPHFERALALDPNNHHVVMLRGWHELQRGNYEEAKRWLERSLDILPWSNFLAMRYLAVVNGRLAERRPRGGVDE